MTKMETRYLKQKAVVLLNFLQEVEMILTVKNILENKNYQKSLFSVLGVPPHQSEHFCINRIPHGRSLRCLNTLPPVLTITEGERDRTSLLLLKLSLIPGLSNILPFGEEDPEEDESSLKPYALALCIMFGDDNDVGQWW